MRVHKLIDSSRLDLLGQRQEFLNKRKHLPLGIEPAKTGAKPR